MSETISESDSKTAGRPPAFAPEHIARLTDYYRRLGKPHGRRTMVNKAYMLRALEIVFPLLDSVPELAHLANKQTGTMHEVLLERLGRIPEEDLLVETAIAVSVFQAPHDCDFQEMRNAWEVLRTVCKPEPTP